MPAKLIFYLYEIVENRSLSSAYSIYEIKLHSFDRINKLLMRLILSWSWTLLEKPSWDRNRLQAQLGLPVKLKLT